MRPADDLPLPMFWGERARALEGACHTLGGAGKTRAAPRTTGAPGHPAVVQRGQSAPFWCTAVLCALSRATEK